MYAGALRIKLNVHRIRNHTQASVLVCASTWAALGERQALDRFLQRQLVLRNQHHTQGGREHGLWDGQKSICSLTSKFLAHALICQPLIFRHSKRDRVNLPMAGHFLNQITLFACYCLLSNHLCKFSQRNAKGPFRGKNFA